MSVRRWVAGTAVAGFAASMIVATGGPGAAAAPSYRYSVTGVIPNTSSVVAVAVDPGLKRLYYIGGDGTSVTGIDTTTDEVVATIPLGYVAKDLTVDPVNHMVLVVSQTGGRAVSPFFLSRIDEASETLTVTADISYTPLRVVVDPTTKIVYMGNLYGTEFGFDEDTLAPAGFNFVSGGIGALADDPATNRLYIGGMDLHSHYFVWVLSGQTGTVTPIPLSAFPLGLAFDSSSRKLYATTFDANAVTVINTATNAVTGTITVGPSPFAIAADSSTHTVYVSDRGSNRLGIINGDVFTGTVYLGSPPGPLAVDPTTHTAYVASTQLERVEQQPCPPSPGNGLMVSTSPYRGNPHALSGTTVTGTTYIFDDAPCTTRSVSFTLDGTSTRAEGSWPYDFAGTGDTTALPFNTGALTKGTHTLTAVITATNGATVIDKAVFTVS
jgi:YVTN family beta-propeller protein